MKLKAVITLARWVCIFNVSTLHAQLDDKTQTTLARHTQAVG